VFRKRTTHKSTKLRQQASTTATKAHQINSKMFGKAPFSLLKIYENLNEC
jgi:hypothetical protein